MKVKDLLEQYEALETEKADRIAEETGDLLAAVAKRRAAVDAEFAERLEIVEGEAVRAVIDRLPKKTHLVYVDYRDGEYWNGDWDRLLLAGDYEALADVNDVWSDEHYENAVEEAKQAAGDLWEYLSDDARDEIRYEVEARNVVDPALEMAEITDPLWVQVERDGWSVYVPLDRAELYRNAWRDDLRIWATGRTQVCIGMDAWGYGDWKSAEISVVLTRKELSSAHCDPDFSGRDELVTVRVLNDDDALGVEAYLTGDRYRVVDEEVVAA